MLKKIEIKNFLTIENVVLNIDRRLTALIGESGAGKSLVLKAIDSVFSQKTPTDIIGKFNDKSSVKLFFELNNRQKKILSNFGIEESEIVIEKIIRHGKAKSYINHEPVNAKLIFAFRDTFVNIISQNYRFEAFSLHSLLHLLDKLVNKKFLDEFKYIYNKFKILNIKEEKIQNEIDTINKGHPEILLESIENVNPQNGEYNELFSKSKKIKSISLIKNEVQKIVDELYEKENSVEHQIGNFVQSSVKMISFGFDVSHIKTAFDNIMDNIGVIKADLYDMLNNSYEAENIDSIESRLFELEQLQRKFNKRIDDIIEEKKLLSQSLQEKEKLEHFLVKLRHEKEETAEELRKRADILTSERKKAVDRIKPTIKMFLDKLLLEDSIIEFEFIKKGIAENGQDNVSILFSANPDIKPDRIESVASGGERSRFILSMECAYSSIENNNDTIILDEIESGISSQTLKKMAEVIKELSVEKQTVLITHNEFLSNISDKIFKITKKFDGTDTKSYAEAVK